MSRRNRRSRSRRSRYNGLNPGDHLEVSRFGYHHHGIYIGDGEVVHYTGDVWRYITGSARPGIQIDSIDTFSDGNRVRVVRYNNCDRCDVVVNRALERLHEQSYSLVFNNCEHFARWCKTGTSSSLQSTAVVRRVGASAGKQATGVLVREGAKRMAGEGAKRLATGVLRRNVISSVAIGCAEQIYDTVQYNRGHISSDEYRRRSGSNVGGVGGAAGGAWLGSFVCPVVGTAVGAAIGSVVGSWLGRQSVD